MRAGASLVVAVWGVLALAGSGCHSSTAVHGPVGPPGDLSVWTAGPGRKIQPTTAVGPATSVSVETCRDATVSFQIVVHGKSGSLTEVELALPDDLTDGQGNTLGKATSASIAPSSST